MLSEVGLIKGKTLRTEEISRQKMSIISAVVVTKEASASYTKTGITDRFCISSLILEGALALSDTYLHLIIHVFRSGEVDVKFDFFRGHVLPFERVFSVVVVAFLSDVISFADKPLLWVVELINGSKWHLGSAHDLVRELVDNKTDFAL